MYCIKNYSLLSVLDFTAEKFHWMVLSCHVLGEGDNILLMHIFPHMPNFIYLYHVFPESSFF